MLAKITSGVLLLLIKVDNQHPDPLPYHSFDKKLGKEFDQLCLDDSL